MITYLLIKKNKKGKSRLRVLVSKGKIIVWRSAPYTRRRGIFNIPLSLYLNNWSFCILKIMPIILIMIMIMSLLIIRLVVSLQQIQRRRAPVQRWGRPAREGRAAARCPPLLHVLLGRLVPSPQRCRYVVAEYHRPHFRPHLHCDLFQVRLFNSSLDQKIIY